MTPQTPDLAASPEPPEHPATPPERPGPPVAAAEPPPGPSAPLPTLPVATPALVVDLPTLEANIARMAAKAAARGAVLRPHVKTHKCLQIAERQRAAGARGITVATVAEAEVFVADGFDDVFIAYPLWLDEARGARLAALTLNARIRVGIDSVAGARQLASALAGAPVEVLVEVDSGHHRTGAPPTQAGPVAVAAQALGLPVVGVFTFPGHSYGRDTRATAAAQEQEALAAAASSLREHGVTPLVVSGGSSPSMAFAASYGPGAVTEWRPGAYVFNDAQQWELEACRAEEIALTVYARVVSHAGGRLVLDAGSKALAADRAPYASGHGRLLDYPQARIVQLTEHHAVCELTGPLPPLGSIVRAVPNHCCTAVNLADELHAVSAGSYVDTWRIAARGANG